MEYEEEDSSIAFPSLYGGPPLHGGQSVTCTTLIQACSPMKTSKVSNIHSFAFSIIANDRGLPETFKDTTCNLGCLDSGGGPAAEVVACVN
jgi:hypothetical protein